jgi:MFS transporter, DHA1 family, multidrug resistance protein
VLSFAMVQDLFEGDAARAKRSYVTVVFGAVPMLAPALGSLLSDVAGWRAVHGTLAIAGGTLLLVTWLGIAESRCADLELFRPVTANRTVRLRDDSRFVGLALANALSYGGIFAYIAGSPVVIIGLMRQPSVIFAVVFACTAAALTAGAWTSGRLSRRGFQAAGLLGPSLCAAAAAALALAVAGLGGIMSGAILLPPLLVVLFSRGIIAPNLQHLAIERRQEQAGAASAAVGVSQLLSGALGSAIVAALLPYWGVSAVAIPMTLFAISALLVWQWMIWSVRFSVRQR